MAVVRRNVPVYLGLCLLGILPLLDFGSLPTALAGTTAIKTKDLVEVVRTGYFFAVSLLIVYLGAQQQDIGRTQAPISGKRAVFAPVFAGGTLFILYSLIKYTQFDPGTIYRLFCCVFGWICVAEIAQSAFGVSPLGLTLAEALDTYTEAEVLQEEERARSGAGTSSEPPLPPTTGETPQDKARILAGGLPAAALATALVLTYLASVSAIGGDDTQLSQLRDVATANNFIAAAIALVSLGQITLESFPAGAALLSGLFLYDAASVFKSDLMVTVATTIVRFYIVCDLLLNVPLEIHLSLHSC